MNPRKYMVLTRYKSFNKVNTYDTLAEARKYIGKGHIYKLVE
jgi:hypothetical protein